MTEHETLESYRRIFYASPDCISFTRMSDGVYIDLNPAFERFLGRERAEVVGKSAIDIGVWIDLEERNHFLKTVLSKHEIHGYQARIRGKGGNICIVESSASMVKVHGEQLLIVIMRDITQRKGDEEELSRYRTQLEQLIQQRTAELQQAHDQLLTTNHKLEEAHNQLLQTEKMASIGQLAAGVAHEINNPVGFVNSNLASLELYVKSLLKVIDAYDLNQDIFTQFPERLQAIAAVKQEVELDYLREDIFALLSESNDGLMRVKKIVQNLKDFSHVGTAEWQFADLHAGLESTLNIVNNEIKYKATVTKEYGDLPMIECLPLELNQVFMNMLVNAAHAIENRGEIAIRTGTQDDNVWIVFSDTGKGISPDNVTRIFDPFFTTKPVGQGTGLGLSLSYGIIQKHHGRIEVNSTVGVGTTFRIVLPIKQEIPASPEAGAAA